ncbi:LysR family transcriptional regulator [Bordetella sp. N]|uniref:LysR family transcriptional regulator n=1 Tax=Bordetella sp. N TaxID=1746199 RepID=UPI0012E3F647|nr:LysR family transcriptional regulator [Bordetella sp. N]
MPLKFDLQDLRLMRAVAEAGSITAGAEAVHLAVASASERIKALEASADTPLFNRVARGVVPTAAGMTVIRFAQTMLEHSGRLDLALKRSTEGLQGEVSIAANSVAISFLRQPLTRFLRDNPGANVTVHEVPSAEAIDMVLQRRVDVGLAALTDTSPAIKARPAFSDKLVVAMAHDHPLASKPAVRFAEVLDFDLLCLRPQSALDRFLTSQAAYLGRRMIRRVAIDDVGAICEMAEAGIGVAVVAKSAVDRYAKQMSLKLLPLTEAWSDRHVSVFWNESLERPEISQALCTAIFD